MESVAPSPLLFAWLYFLEGAPIGLIWWALPAELTLRGMDVERLTALTSLLVLPWAFKFLWAPAMERLAAGRGGYKIGIVLSQAGMAASLLPLLLGPGEIAFSWIAVALVLHSVCAASQDVAIDGMALALAPSEIRGRLNGAMQMGMLTGRWAFGSGLLLGAGWISFRGGLAGLVVLLVLSAGVLVSLPVNGHALPEEEARHVGSWYRRMVTGRARLLAVAVALLSGLGYEAMGAVVSPFLFSLGFGKEAVGSFYTFSLLMLLLGAWLGGWGADRWGHRNVFALSILGVAALACTLAVGRGLGAGGAFAFTILTGLYGIIGAFTASSYAFFMDLSEGDPLRATTFSAYMGLTNGCEALAAFLVGRLIPVVGYSPAFVALAMISLIGLWGLRGLRTRGPSPSDRRPR